MNIENINKVFFIGIGGIGMSGLAKYFIEKGISVLGYDREKSFITTKHMLQCSIKLKVFI